ncbi:MAG: methyltransferase domain-containing protein [Desulfobacteraceae bacterium]|nr:methyltransferase domain-containing protein [Desulfobacteraceae bacterium]
MTDIRKKRRHYYDIFSHFYDWFIRTHSRRDEDETRKFIADHAAEIIQDPNACFLDLCCGTGSVILAFEKRFPEGLCCGYDFSHGMLLRLAKKDAAKHVDIVEGDAAVLPFKNDYFDVVTCSHAFYELKGGAREKSIAEVSRVLSPSGAFLLMEHEVPEKPLIKALFFLRMAVIGADDASEFIGGDFTGLEKYFRKIDVTHSPSGKSLLVVCHK